MLKLGSGHDIAAQVYDMTSRSGATKLHRLDENNGAVSVELTPGDLGDIHDAASKITVQDARYSEKLEQMTGR
jgi:hypothetical protein